MPVEERRRLALHRLVADAWGEEAADTLFELVTPSGRELATTEDVAGLHRDIVALGQRLEARFTRVDEEFHRVDEQFTRIDERFDRIEERFSQVDERFEMMDERWVNRSEALEHRLKAAFERRISDAVTTQTRTLVVSQLAALITIAALAFGLR